MPDYNWPEPGTTAIIGKRVSRVDGPAKVSGAAKYTHDLKRPGMLYAKMLRSPHAHAKVISIDTSAAEKLPGVAAVQIVQEPGKEILWAGDDVVAVAATTDQIAEDALRLIKVEYEKLPHLVNESDRAKAASRARPAQEQVVGDPDAAFAQAEVVVEGDYGLPVVTHCCLETHGQVAEWEGDSLTVYPSSQGVQPVANQFAQALEIPATNVRTLMQYVGGGFGSKFAADRWDITAARLSRKAGGKPVRIFLERDA